MDPKITNWFKDNYNLVLIGILILAFIIRLKYLTINGGLWWDEATYLNGGKYWGLGEPFWQVESARPPLFMLFIALFFKLGFNEMGVRFMVLLIPSVLAVLMTYLLGKELYNKDVGLISSFMMAVFWVLIFNTSRVHTDPLALLFGMLAIYLFWKGYIASEKKNALYIYLAGLCLGLGFLTRLATLLIIPIFLIFLFLTDKFKFIKSKPIWLAVLLGFLTTIPYMIWGKIVYNNFFPWVAQYSSGATRLVTTTPIAWNLLKYFQLFTQEIFFVTFLIGLIPFIDLIFGLDLIFKGEENRLKPDLFLIINIIVVLAFFMFITRIAEPRWLMLMAPAVFFISARGIIYVYDIIKKYNNVLGIIIILIILGWGGYAQLDYNKEIINIKKDTYIMEKPAGEWLKENTNPNDILIAGNEHAPLTYFSEREIMGFGSNETAFWIGIENRKPKYLILTTYYQSEQWVFNLPGRYSNIFIPISIFYHDLEKTYPAVIIYEIVF